MTLIIPKSQDKRFARCKCGKYFEKGLSMQAHRTWEKRKAKKSQKSQKRIDDFLGFGGPN